MYGGEMVAKVGRAALKRPHSSLSSHLPPIPLPRGVSADRDAPSGAAEVTFSLVPGGSNPAAFSMIIRLSPDLVEEIKRVEAQGGKARIKFDSNPNNTTGNIIEVGGKKLRYTWSREFGDLCDIYEERQSGEDGNGLLVESGCAWRKLNVQRILDESTKNHVKMRSAEAERKFKSRKAIVLEPGNPSMKRQIGALAAVNATLPKNYNKNKEAAPKKRKVETLQVGGPPKSTYKPGLSSTATKGRLSSALSSTPDQPATSSSPLGAVNISKSIDDVVPSQMNRKLVPNAGPEKEIPARANNATRDSPGGKGDNVVKPIDLQSMLISLLMDKPNGLTLKALEKAVQPNSKKEIEPIVRKIAIYKSPGRYILLPGVHLESFKKPQTESGSSLDDIHHQIPALHEDFKEKGPNDDFKELMQLNSKFEEELGTLEKTNVHHASPDIFGGKKGNHCSEGRGGSSSDSGSDSESDSSDSGSDTGSHGRSLAGTGNGSDNNSEKDASSNSKKGLDEDVDIMTSGDQEESQHKTEASIIPVKSPDGRSSRSKIDEKQDNTESEAVEIEKDFPEEQEAEMVLTTTTIPRKGGKSAGVGLESIDKSPVVNGRGIYHQRDLSELELCELRESTPDETNVAKQLERKNSIEHLENKANTSEERNPDVLKVKPPSLKTTSESRKPSLAIVSSCFPSNLESTNSKNLDDLFEDSTRSLARVMQSQHPFSEKNCGVRSNESGLSQGVDLEGSNENSGRALPNASFSQDITCRTVVYPVKESKRQIPSSLEEVADTGKDSGFTHKNNIDKIRTESSSDESSCSYLKYEKDAPDLKGPIRTISQYKEYVQEFHDKYDCYSYLKKTLENYRHEFCNLGKDLEYAKNRDVGCKYYDILGKLKESYQHYGMKHKRQKKIYVVLHLELEQLKRRIKDYVDSYNKK